MITKRNSLLVLSVMGIGVSAYLAYTKLTSSPIICGGNSGCGIVQNSPYSTVIGIPLGIWGMAYFFFLFSLFYIENIKKAGLVRSLAVLWGLVFSLYLTYLEAFVIKAYCLWCLASFVIIILVNMIFFIKLPNKKKENKNENSNII